MIAIRNVNFTDTLWVWLFSIILNIGCMHEWHLNIPLFVVCVCRAHFATLLGIQRLKRGLYKRKYDKLIVFDSICLVSQSTIAVSLGCFFYLTTAPWEWILTPHSTKAIRQAERGRRELLNEDKKKHQPYWIQNDSQITLVGWLLNGFFFEHSHTRATQTIS